MQTYTMVRPEHLNHHGHLFGGQLLLWVDEYAWMAAARENPGCKLVTRAMDRIEFQRPAPVGSILRFDITQKCRGRTSLSYSVDVYCDAPGESQEYRIFTTTITFVSVDERGEKSEICPPCPGDA
jgi:acyl-CoA hydrolase